jgi:hypothetical protein
MAQILAGINEDELFRIERDGDTARSISNELAGPPRSLCPAKLGRWSRVSGVTARLAHGFTRGKPP